MRVLWCGREFPVARQLVVDALPDDQVVVCNSDDVAESASGAHVAIPAMSRIDADAMDAGDFRLIQQFGVGVDGVDLSAARARGIVVANVPTQQSANAASVGEMALLHILSLTRKYAECRRSFQAGGLGVPLGRSLTAMQVVVVGTGAVARAVAERLRPFGCRIHVVGRRQPTDMELDRFNYLDDLPRCLEGATVLVVACALTPETTGLVGKSELSALAPGSYVINIARGGIVDQEALHLALLSGHVAGAGLDVFWQEPFDATHPILAQNVSVTPHVAGVTVESYTLMAAAVAENINRLRRGERLANVVTC